MLYMDNAATSFPKPEEVYQAVDNCLRNLTANPNRSNTQSNMEPERIIYATRKSIAKLFNIKNPNRIIFTFNATDSLNLAIKGIVEEGDEVIASPLEHNSVIRTLNYLKETKDIRIIKIKASKEGIIDPEDVRKKITTRTRLIVLTHASNVLGTISPIEEVGDIAREHNIVFLVDAAQTAGAYPIDVEKLKIDLLAFSGHKGLLGPQGTGGLYIREGITLTCLRHGGTGSKSESEVQPDFLPDRYESGTLNMPGIAGLNAGIDFIQKETIEKIRKHKEALTQKLLNGLKEIDKLIIYGPQDLKRQVPLVSFNINGYKSQEVSDALANVFGIITRAGLHCSPWAHELIETISVGTVRLSLGYFTREEDISYAVSCLRKIVKV